MDVERAHGTSRPRRARPSVRARAARTGAFWTALGTAVIAVSGCGRLVTPSRVVEDRAPRAEAASVAATGATGPTGRPGADGRDGLPGSTGAQGKDGALGATGAAGLEGVAGRDGDVGPMGPAGVQGVTGATGPEGVAGRDGSDGAPGPTGATGVQGATGSSGVNTFTIASASVTAAGLGSTTATVSCPSGSVGIAPSWDTTYAQIRVLNVAPLAGGATWSFRLYNGSTTPDPSVIRLVCVVGSYGG
ncbi:MAG: hypothetical protein ACKOZL_02095 [Actinomycetes bacterium]